MIESEFQSRCSGCYDSILFKVKLKIIFQVSATKLTFFIVFRFHFYLFCTRSYIIQILGSQDHFELKVLINVIKFTIKFKIFDFFTHIFRSATSKTVSPK